MWAEFVPIGWIVWDDGYNKIIVSIDSKLGATTTFLELWIIYSIHIQN